MHSCISHYVSQRDSQNDAGDDSVKAHGQLLGPGPGFDLSSVEHLSKMAIGSLVEQAGNGEASSE